MTRTRKKGVSPAVAIVLLVLGVAVAARSVLGALGGAPAGDPNAAAASGDPGPSEDGEAQADERPAGSDLLAVHGSFVRGTAVQNAFPVFVDAASTAAAPMGETSQGSVRWRGEDPPMLRLGVVMVSDVSRRAVLGGHIVGIGDAVADGRVVAIEAGVVSVLWRGRQLTYDLDQEAPREFRAEQQRRAAANKDARADDSSAVRKEEGQ